MSDGRSYGFDAERMAVEKMELREAAHGFRYSRDNTFREYEMRETEREEQHGAKDHNNQTDDKDGSTNHRERQAQKNGACGLL